MTATWSREEARKLFRDFSAIYTKGVEPLYEVICAHIAEDDALLDLSRHTLPGQPAPNLLLGAVHYLVLYHETDDPLAQYFRSVTSAPRPPETAFPVFRRFCTVHRERIAQIVATRVTNTNEVGRSTCLMPGFLAVKDLAGERPLHLVEIGPSAGLNLFWDRFHYDYGADGQCGVPDSAVRLKAVTTGHAPANLHAAFPRIASRRGIEANPMDIRDPDTARWLRALLWPNRPERAERLEAAIRIAQADPPTIVSGWVQDHLAEVLAVIPAGDPVCLFHSMVYYQIPADIQAMLHAVIEEAARSRPVFEVAFEDIGESRGAVDVITHGRGGSTKRLALATPHGAEIDWVREEK